MSGLSVLVLILGCALSSHRGQRGPRNSLIREAICSNSCLISVKSIVTHRRCFLVRFIMTARTSFYTFCPCHLNTDPFAELLQRRPMVFSFSLSLLVHLKQLVYL